MDDTITTTGTTTTVGPLPPTTGPHNRGGIGSSTSMTAPPGIDSPSGITSESSLTPVAPVSGDARTSKAVNSRRFSGSSSTGRTGGTGIGHGGMRKWGADPAQSMSRMGTGARDTSDSKLIDDSTKLFPSTSSSTGGEMGFSGGISGIGAGEGEGNVFRNERNASISSTSSTGSDRLMGPASAVTEYPHPRRSSHGLFEGLTAQKRRNDPASVARRQSLSEQRPSTGFIAKMWDNWVRGVPPDI
ncbi:hypothetical protein SMACR_04887 [Sordaria macrospora]|uniref:Conidiation-specific expression protein n=2 Tax=Sordaria macrospora TaxID=5147 RepID=A0A8S8ZHG7_SORMA|nr:putative conidiation-specific expression protein [Sordaria macrospora k-hell]KAA8627802.1 hypothetical protein SMACR_04887 [Sordaria macrospora]KAH7627302.1 putative conidiation-specific expression protein [Sordaria sp. MPI-SDFR-AT-0083]WPJ59462.1 hypothetical protein SMAC4_04887 [Sordaria macrospora]CCC06494.1 putative conidiation-specific expression protein [Sordaria macrospora k-hell]